MFLSFHSVDVNLVNTQRNCYVLNLNNNCTQFSHITWLNSAQLRGFFLSKSILYKYMHTTKIIATKNGISSYTKLEYQITSWMNIKLLWLMPSQQLVNTHWHHIETTNSTQPIEALLIELTWYFVNNWGRQTKSTREQNDLSKFLFSKKVGAMDSHKLEKIHNCYSQLSGST